MSTSSSEKEQPKGGLSSAKREDIWALIIAAAIFGVSAAAPEAVYTFFKKMLFIF